MSNILECRSLSFNYGDGNSKTSVLKNLDFRVKTEERIAIIGQKVMAQALMIMLVQSRKVLQWKKWVLVG